MFVRRLLVVEGDQTLRSSVNPFFQEAGWSVFGANSLDGARSLVPVLKPAVIIIDRELIDGDGLDLICEATKINAHAFIVSIRDNVEDRIQALSIGAVDYLKKPAHPMELFFRVRNFLEIRIDFTGDRATIRDFAGVKVDLTTRGLVRADGSQREVLTPTELAVLRILADNVERVVGRDILFPLLKSRAYFDKASRSVDTCVSRLRLKLRSADAGAQVYSVREAGYVLRRCNDITA